MRVPYRKPGKFSQLKNDPYLTKEKFEELEKDLERLKKQRPHLASEVSRLAELGDFSENAEYQLAKGKLRGLNNAILKLEAQIRDAVIVNSNGSDRIQLGSTVTVECGGKEKIYQILGSVETDPERGIISYQSPLGSLLMGKMSGETVVLKLGGREVRYLIKEIK